MNAYFVDAGDQRVFQEYIAGYPRYETERECDVVFAETRGQAKATFLAEHHEVEWTEIESCRLIRRSVERERGIAASNDDLWDVVPVDADEWKALKP